MNFLSFQFCHHIIVSKDCEFRRLDSPFFPKIPHFPPGFWFSNGFLVGSLRDPELNLTLGRSIMTDRLIGRSFSHLQSVLHDVSRLVMRWDMNLPITRPQRTQSDSGWRLATVGGNHWDLVFWDIFFEISIFFMKKMAPKRV